MRKRKSGKGKGRREKGCEEKGNNFFRNVVVIIFSGKWKQIKQGSLSLLFIC